MDGNKQIPRTLVPQESYSSIDAVLKDLKHCLRRIHNALATHADEHQLLQRIFYKNKNQHRGALFWRRVAEMRRYSERLNNADISLTLEEIRNSFFDPDAKQNSKLLKGAWTHAPSTKSARDAIDRLHKCEALLQKMQEKSLQAYQSFTLAMQSGAFVQLLLVLVAIASRLRTLSIDIGEAVSMSCSSMARFLTLDTALLMNQAQGSSDALPPLSKVTAGTEDDGNGKNMDVRNTSEQAAPIVQQVVPRVNVKRRLEPARRNIHDQGSGKMQAKKVKKVKRANNEIDEIFSAI
ncbi:hypothetical protein JOM56_003572 [Amanita muscaria]